MGMNIGAPSTTSVNPGLNLASSIRSSLSITNATQPDEFVKEAGPEAGQAQVASENVKKAALAAIFALAAAGVTYVVMRGKNADDLQKAQREAADAINKARDEIMNSVQDVQKRAADTLDEATKIKNEAEAEIAKGVDAARSNYSSELERLNSAIKDSQGGGIDERLYKALKNQIDEYKLDYDPTKPPIKERIYYSWDNVMEFLPFKKSNTRANMQALNIPEYKWGKDWSFELPISSEMRPSRMENINFTPFPKRLTNISMDYANSVKWDDDKIARDLLQNFYDGHGQTLDGVKFNITSLPNGKSKIRIEGRGLYTPDKAILLGETSKADDAMAAGNYGEGLKMAVLKILKDKGASEIKIGADGWNVTYDVARSDIADKSVLQYSLDRVAKPFDGNYIEFETNNEGLAKSLKGAIDHFYHSGNTDFKAVDFENSLFGIKKLPKGEKGSAYITGQKFEYGQSGQWDGLDGTTVFFKQKPPTKIKSVLGEEEIFNPSRDRVALSDKNIQKIVDHFASSESTSNDDIFQALRAMEDDWTNLSKDDSATKSILEGLLDGARRKNIKINFPDNYIADSYNASPEMVDSLVQSGYKVCNEKFHDIGMQNINEFMIDARNHNAFDMTELQKKKVGLIRTAIQKLSPYLDRDFTPSELNPKVYLFDAKSDKEAANYKSTWAEAIISECKSDGYWLDRNYLDTASFAELVGTGLHEITHKVGGDESMEFSYKLTDVLEKVIQASADEKNVSFISEWRNMNKLWDELNAAK